MRVAPDQLRFSQGATGFVALALLPEPQLLAERRHEPLLRQRWTCAEGTMTRTEWPYRTDWSPRK
jgi:hypothetical protein